MNRIANRKDSTEEGIGSIPAMAFHHEEGLVPSWKFASRFAGKTGRVATLPDVINARLETEIGSIPWERYFTTLTAEYVGRKRDGSMAIIVAHGVGPMSTLDGILKAYSYEYKDEDRDRRGGRITQEEFWGLEDGKYGKVDIIDLEELLGAYQYPFLEVLSKFEAAAEPLLSARFGPNARKYIEKHAEIAYEWHKEKGHDMSIVSKYADVWDPYIIEMGDASNCSYRHYLPEDNMALAHLISIGGLSDCNHQYFGGRMRSLICDVGCHEWSNGVRFVGINVAGKIADIHRGPENVDALIYQNWPVLMKPVSQITPMPIGLRVLKKIGKETWFTQYPKMGASIDTCEPEFQVTSMDIVGEPVDFTTEIGGYELFFRYDIKEVEVMTPIGANAYYLVGDIEVVNDKWHHVKIQFCHIEADTTQRLIREEKLRNDYDTLMNLVTKE